MTTQVCLVCNIEKPINEFEKQKNRPSPRKKCKSCRYLERDLEKERKRHREYQKQRRATCPDKLRQNWERSVYGVCKEDLNQPSCVICGSTNRLCIDHDHETSVVRGILCTKCNAGIGMFDDNISKMLKAIEYLMRHNNVI